MCCMPANMCMKGSESEALIAGFGAFLDARTEAIDSSDLHVYLKHK